MERPTTRLLLRVFVVSVAINALLGIGILVFGDLGETQGRILGTSLLLSATMLGILVNGPAAARGVLWPVPIVGAVTAAIGLGMLIVAVWADGLDGNWFRSAGSFLVVAVAATLAGGLALLPLAGRYRPALPTTVGLIAMLTACILFAIWVEYEPDWFLRLVGVLSLLVAAGTIVIPVLSRFAGDEPAGAADVDREVPAEAAVRYCPSCGYAVGELPVGTAVGCGRCGFTFEVLEAAGALDPSDRH